MYRKILSFLIILCLCIGNFTNTIVYAEENDEGAVIAVETSGEDEPEGFEESNIVIPQNGSEVYMEGMGDQPATFGLRSSGGTSNERYTVLVLDSAAAADFMSNGSVFYTADSALPYVKEASKKFIKDIKDAPGENYIAIVSYKNSTSKIELPFTKDTDALLDAIDSIYAGEREMFTVVLRPRSS